MTVAETQPSIKGATVTGSATRYKETGLSNVPDFPIEAGQKLVINTTGRKLTFLVHRDISGCQIERNSMATEQFGDIVIAPRVLEKIIAIATAKVECLFT